MDTINSVSLINKNYTKIIDIVGEELKNIDEIKSKVCSVEKLLWESIDMDKSIYSRILSSYNFIWNNMPKEAFSISNIDELNKSIYNFALYIDEIGDEYTDHGYTLFIAYYLKVCKDFLQTCI